MKLRSAFGFSMIESVGSRGFDLITLWLVLNNLPSTDLANFGLATASIVFFNLVFFVPETALLRFQKTWSADGVLNDYLSAYLTFSLLKILFHLLMLAVAIVVLGASNWFIYAVVFSIITQQIQMSEIARISFRMNLRQKFVAVVELLTKLLLCVLCLALLKWPSLYVYFSIFLVWSIAVSVFWTSRLLQVQELRILRVAHVTSLILESMKGFSLWSQINGNLTHYIYNSALLFLGWSAATTEDIALYTVVIKVSNLFFVVPMMAQSFVPVLLANTEPNSEKPFRKLMVSNAVVSLTQFALFAVLGEQLGRVFGLKSDSDLLLFWQLGLVLNLGIFVLNCSRPLSTWLLIKGKPQTVLLAGFLPSAILASILYPMGAYLGGLIGAAICSALVYLFLSTTFFTLRAKQLHKI